MYTAMGLNDRERSNVNVVADNELSLLVYKTRVRLAMNELSTIQWRTSDQNHIVVNPALIADLYASGGIDPHADTKPYSLSEELQAALPVEIPQSHAQRSRK
jgi:hypothetical protein